jgi:Protein of unknown function (DUF1573)
MWKLAFTLAAVALSAAPVQVQQPPSAAWANKIFLNRTDHDFGTVARGAQLKYSFPIKNIYAVPLEITNVRVTCGCLSATPSKKSLKPQEEATLDVVMDGRRFSGPKSITVYLTVGPEFISTAELHVTANARSDVVFNPGEINFGVVSQGQQPVQTVDVEYAGMLDWRVKEVVKPSDAPFNVTMEEVYRKPPSGPQPGRVAYKMVVKLAPDAPAGSLKHDLMLKTNDPASEVLILTVDGMLQSALRVAPNQVSLGTLKLGETKTFKVQVLGNRPFRITEVKTDGKEISAELPQQAQPSHTLTLRCQPQSVGDLRRTLTIMTDLEKGASVTVFVQAHTAPP